MRVFYFCDQTKESTSRFFKGAAFSIPYGILLVVGVVFLIIPFQSEGSLWVLGLMRGLGALIVIWTTWAYMNTIVEARLDMNQLGIRKFTQYRQIALHKITGIRTVRLIGSGFIWVRILHSEIPEVPITSSFLVWSFPGHPQASEFVRILIGAVHSSQQEAASNES